MSYEKEILEYVRQHPGCGRVDLLAAIGGKNVANEIDCMVVARELDRWYTDHVPAYYIPGTYTPPHLRESEAEMRERIPLAAGLHRDGTIHIYVNEEDSGLSVGLLENDTLIVKVAGSMRTMVAGKA